MTGFIITIVCLVAFVFWMIWEYKHAPLMPEDIDEETQKLINDRNNHDNFNNPAI
jgi:hypothetical protein